MGGLGASLVAWVVLPALLCAVSLGLGLLACRIARFDVPNALIAPIGLCVAVVLAMPAYRLDVGAWPSTLLALGGAALGLFLSRGELRERANPGAAGLAALAVYALYLAPVVLAGGWTWTGYNFVNDTAVQLQLIDHLAENGIEHPTTQARIESASTSDASVYFYLRAFYPLGAHGLLAALGKVIPAPTAALYQPFLALLAGFGAGALTALAARVTRSGLMAALAGAVAVAANLLYAYGLQGNIKEVAAFATLAVAAAAGRELLANVHAGSAAIFAICLAAILAVYSSAGAPFVGALAVTVLGVALWRAPRPRVLKATLAGAGVLAVAVLVAANDLLQSFQVFSDAFGAEASDDASQFEDAGGTPSELGQLLRPLPLAQAAGVWLSRDYRTPVGPGAEPWNVALIAAMLLLALAGLALQWRRREGGPLLMLVPTLATVALAGPRVSPYAEAKLLAILSPAVVLLAALGVVALARLWLPLAVVGAAAVAGGVLGSNALSYHSVQLGPVDRMLAMEQVAERYRGRGELLVTEPDELVKYFMRAADNISIFDPISPRQVQLRVPQNYVGRAFDLDEQKLVLLESAPWLVQRRAPDASRPPANFTLDYENRFYRVWRRGERPEVKDHLPLQAVHTPIAQPDCAEVRRLAGRARPGDRLVAADRAPVLLLEPSLSHRPPGWVPHPLLQRVVVAQTPGRSWRDATVPAGRYRVWVQGSFGRPMSAYVGDRRIGQAQGINSTGQWHLVGDLRSPGGRTRLELRRGGGGLAPGDGSPASLGALALEPIRPTTLVSVPPGRASRLCERRWDWIELVAKHG